MNRFALVAVIALTALSTPLAAQQPGAAGGTVLQSEPGKATLAWTAEISAQVVGIDAATRTVTLKGSKGQAADVVAGEDVRNFAQIKLGDFVVVRYLQGLTLELKTTKAEMRQPSVGEGAAPAPAGERPAGVVARQVNVLATVTAVDPKKKRITLKGPRGNVVEQG